MFGKKKYDFYLGGPMRGYKELNKPMFCLVSHILRKRGFTVWSPVEHASYLKLSFGQVMTIDLNQIVNRCRKIALLPGWRSSLGSNMEAFAAFACGKEAFEVNTDFELVPIDLSAYALPYKIGETSQFDPHKCSLNSSV